MHLQVDIPPPHTLVELSPPEEPDLKALGLVTPERPK
jgi:hypothetical protein